MDDLRQELDDAVRELKKLISLKEKSSNDEQMKTLEAELAQSGKTLAQSQVK